MGTYLVSGEATGLNGATVTVSAVRNLSNGLSNQAPLYSVLDRQFAEVSDGQWQTQLQLWQLGDGASPRESWQRDQVIFDRSLTPDSEVNFMVTLDPVEAVKWPKAIAEKRSNRSTTVRYTPDGDKYIAAYSPTTIPIPNVASSTIDSSDSSAVRRIRDREVITVTPENRAGNDAGQLGTTSRTTAPLTPKQYLQ